jgi:hypothetical protein
MLLGGAELEVNGVAFLRWGVGILYGLDVDRRKDMLPLLSGAVQGRVSG